MKKSPWTREIRRDCLRYMRGAIAVRFFLDSTALAAPTVSAWLIGGMADALLLLDRVEIDRRLPLFLLALALNVLGVPLLRLLENLLLTENGFAYDRYLVGRYLRLPLKRTQAYDSSAVVTRSKVDVTDYYFYRIYRWTRPPVLGLYLLFLGSLLCGRRYPFGFMVLLSLAALPVLRAYFVGARAAGLAAEAARYQEDRRAMEHALFDGRDFLREYGLAVFVLQKTRDLFDRYMASSGGKRAALDAGGAALDLLCGYGVKALVAAAGALYVSAGRMTAGDLLTGFLLLPHLTDTCRLAAEWIAAIRGEPEAQKRIEFFYGQLEPVCGDLENPPESLQVREVGFSYPGEDRPVLEDVTLEVSREENLWLRGGNGCGKSTLAAVLCGLYPPERGSVCGGDGKALSVATLRRLTAYQEQEGAIFSGDIDFNLFAPRVPHGRKRRLLEELGLKKPLDFPVEAQGVNLSPGERKKVLLCRALLKEALFLVLDEPLNHLDPAAKEALGALLARRGRGTVLISHRDLWPAGERPITLATFDGLCPGRSEPSSNS